MEKTIYLLLNEKFTNLEKKRQRFYFYIYVLFVLYLILKNINVTQLDEIYVFGLSLKDINIVLILFPLIISIILLYITIITFHTEDIQDEMKSFEETFSMELKKKKWKYLIKPLNPMSVVLQSIKAGGWLGCLGALFVYIPIISLVVLLPVFFYFYTLYNNFIVYKDNPLSLIFSIFSIWIFIINIIYLVSEEK